MKSRELIKRLRQAGATIISGRGKGGHVLVVYREKQTTVPVHGNTDWDPNFVKTICKQLGIDPEKIL